MVICCLFVHLRDSKLFSVQGDRGLPGAPGPVGPPGPALIGPKVICTNYNDTLLCHSIAFLNAVIAVCVQIDRCSFLSCRVQLVKWDYLVHLVYLERASKDKRYCCHLSVVTARPFSAIHVSSSRVRRGGSRKDYDWTQ